MNAWLTLREWSQFAGTLALELALVFVGAKLATLRLRLRSASWRRAVWQMTIIALSLVAVGELNGVRGWLQAPRQSQSSPPQKKVIVTIKDADPALFNESDFTDSAPGNTGLDLRKFQGQQRVRWPAIVWLIVAAPLLGRLVFAQLLALAIRLFSRRISDGTTNAKARRLAGMLGIDRKFMLLISKRAVAPFTFGVWKPAIVLPQDFPTTFTPEQQDVALAHELAHVAGLDSAWRGFSQFTCALLWWHPLVWLAKRELDHASELVADESSLLLADGPDRLAECLLACAKQLRRPALAGWLGMDGGGFRSALGKRVARLLQLHANPEVTRRVPWYLRLVAPLVCTALVWTGAVALTKPDAAGAGAWSQSILGSAFAAADKAPAIPPNKPATEAAKTEVAPAPPAAPETGLPATNSTPLDPRRQAIYDKLRATHFPEFGPIDNLPLSEVLRALNDDMRRRDPERKGVNLMINGALSDPNEVDTAGLPVAPVDLSGTTIRLGTKLRDVTCEEILNIIASIADRPIQYTVETYAVVFTPKARSRQTMHTRFFRIDPPTLMQSLNSMQPPVTSKPNSRNTSRGGARAQTNQPNGGIAHLNETVLPAVRKWLDSMGVDLTAPDKAVFFNDQLGVLMVRATAEELDTIEKAMQMLNMSPPQLTIRVKVMEVARDAKGRLGSDLFLGSIGAATNGVSVPARLANDLTVDGLRNAAPQAATVTGILNDEQFRSVIKALEQRGGTDLLSAPEITTVSGRPAQIKVVDVKYIVTDLDITDKTPKRSAKPDAAKGDPTVEPQVTQDGSIIQPIAEPFELGPVVDIIPWVQTDGHTIQMTVIPSLQEFLGYDDPGAFVTEVGGKTNKLSSPTPLPKFRVRKVQTSAVVADGQTLVIGAGSARHPVQKSNPDGTTTNTFVEKELFYFITPSLIDAAGNLLHPK